MRSGWRRHRGAPCRRRPGGYLRGRAGGPGQRDLEGVEAMIPIPAGVRVWIPTGHTDMRKGMAGLALQVQEALKRDSYGGDLYIFRGRRADLCKILWRDDLGVALRQASGAWSLHLARRRRGRDPALAGSDGLSARGDRLAEPSAELASAGGRISCGAVTPAQLRGASKGSIFALLPLWRKASTRSRRGGRAPRRRGACQRGGSQGLL